MISSSANAISSWYIATGPRRADHALQVISFECFIPKRVLRCRHISQPDLFEYNIGSRDCRLYPVGAYALELTTRRDLRVQAGW